MNAAEARHCQHCECFYLLLNLTKRCCYCAFTPYMLKLARVGDTHKARKPVLVAPDAPGGQS